MLWTALALSASLSAAADVTVETRAREVTVYPQTARVLRTGKAALSAGPVSVSFPDLPASAEDASLRLSVMGPKGTKLYGIQFKNVFTPEIVERRSKELQEQIRNLEDQKVDTQDRMTSRATEIEMLKEIAKREAGRVGERAVEKPGGLAELPNGTAAIARRIASLLSENRKDERGNRSLDEKISSLRNQLSQVGAGARERKAAEADLELASDGEVSFTLSYQVPNAGWSPIYDARLEGEESPKVELVFAGQVRQRTGEDWNGVKLSLSTSRPTGSSQAPDPTNWWLDFARRYPVRTARSGGRGMKESMAPAAAPMAMARTMEIAEPPVEAEVAEAQTERAEFATNFSIARPAVIPSDGSDHRVQIAQKNYDASILLVTVPRLAQTVFVQAEVKYEGDQPLLPGNVQIFRGGDFAGTAYLKGFAPGETFELGFGQDDNVKVERKLLAQKSGEGGFFSKAGRKYRWVTTVKNFHTGKRAIEVREQLPRSRQEKIVVETGEISPEPLPEDPSRPKLLRWKLDLAAKGEAKLVFAYSVKYPEGSDVSGME